MVLLPPAGRTEFRDPQEGTSLKKEPRFPYKNEFGRFSPDGRSFIITRPDTPRPWANILCSESYGAAVSQTGSGYSWLNDATRNRLTRWGNDLVRDDLGRYLYLRDDSKGNFWSVGWQPTQAKL